MRPPRCAETEEASEHLRWPGFVYAAAVGLRGRPVDGTGAAEEHLRKQQPGEGGGEGQPQAAYDQRPEARLYHPALADPIGDDASEKAQGNLEESLPGDDDSQPGGAVSKRDDVQRHENDDAAEHDAVGSRLRVESGFGGTGAG